MIDVKNLTKSFGDLEVLKGVSQHISKGERVVLIGPSGSGKSTFLRCLNLLETPTAGQIIFFLCRRSCPIFLQKTSSCGQIRRKYRVFPFFPVC